MMHFELTYSWYFEITVALSKVKQLNYSCRPVYMTESSIANYQLQASASLSFRCITLRLCLFIGNFVVVHAALTTDLGVNADALDHPPLSHARNSRLAMTAHSVRTIEWDTDTHFKPEASQIRTICNMYVSRRHAACDHQVAGWMAQQALHWPL